MANEEHVALLKQGVEVWNEWRKADLHDALLRGADLSLANLIDADLSGATLRDANLSGADFSRATVTAQVPALWFRRCGVSGGGRRDFGSGCEGCSSPAFWR
jgi:uncharacterized protein YjbI with pentapeptide repeats